MRMQERVRVNATRKVVHVSISFFPSLNKREFYEIQIVHNGGSMASNPSINQQHLLSLLVEFFTPSPTFPKTPHQ